MKTKVATGAEEAIRALAHEEGDVPGWNVAVVWSPAEIREAAAAKGQKMTLPQAQQWIAANGAKLMDVMADAGAQYLIENL